MPEFGGSHIAAGVWTRPVDMETLETYEENIHHYQNQNYTYIPMPKDDKYYNVEEGWIRDLDSEQYIYEDSLLSEVFHKLTEFPFLIGPGDVLDEVLIKDGRVIGKVHNRTDEPLVVMNDEPFPPERVSLDSVDYDTKTRLVNLEKGDIDNSDAGWPYKPIEHFSIITLADLNKRNAKEAIYPVLADLSQKFSNIIYEYYPDSSHLLKYANPATIGIWYREKEEGMELHMSEFMNLTEMKKAIKGGDDSLIESCGFESKTQFENTMGGVIELRNHVMHANRTLIHSRRDLRKLNERVEDVEEILTSLSKEE